MKNERKNFSGPTAMRWCGAWKRLLRAFERRPACRKRGMTKSLCVCKVTFSGSSAEAKGSKEASGSESLDSVCWTECALASSSLPGWALPWSVFTLNFKLVHSCLSVPFGSAAVRVDTMMVLQSNGHYRNNRILCNQWLLIILPKSQNFQNPCLNFDDFEEAII